MGGYLTPGLPIVGGDTLSGQSRVPVDTGLDNGANPQSAAMIPGTLPFTGEITAQANGSKASATPLDYGINEVTVVPGAADSVLLPYAYPGAVAVVLNTVATAIQVFGRGTDTVDGVATGTGIDQAASARAIYFGVAGNGDGSDVGRWISMGAAAA